ncbi:TPA: type I restriction endonuclease subunit M [Vibrio vulnificus]|nr:type I restriction endonuclease subunit M [Vibrio vulnificus]HDY8021377.1 type I restriction endonuclease subunit M [Vibrio vulnificus]HDY8043835.1 type I restriction endonuclease subunit M [Vibrio vulnificus]
MYSTNVIENKEQRYFPASIDFDLGEIVVTQGVIKMLDILPVELLQPFLARHKGGDWGHVCVQDKQQNDHATRYGDRILSSYKFCEQCIWIITEADRSVTTILLPSEY